ncbi:histidine phosphatase family protein [Bacteroidia bacterium]|nr:histidine phosphatase family protein [Bacteroidia bacterium]MDB9882832.1 histidine phosphatase family protein [Bacteroidia bacterium]MDC1394944.1 histidine phosphatase family protein [Bacteroidia bacterium]
MSTKKTIYIIRHGETDYNKKGIVQGSGIDSDLNDAGRKQAEQFYKAYHHIRFDKIYTSELKRTQQSVARFAEAGYKPHPMAELNEINWGIFEGLVSTPDSIKVYHNMVADWRAGLLDRCVQNGETPNALQRRQKQGLEKLMARTDEKKILIAMHGRAMRSFMCLLTQTPLQRMDEFKHNNLCLYVLEQDGNNFKVVEQNCSKHLWI